MSADECLHLQKGKQLVVRPFVPICKWTERMLATDPNLLHKSLIIDNKSRTNSNLFLTSAPVVVSALAAAVGASAPAPPAAAALPLEDCLELLLRTISFIWRLTAIALYACCKEEEGGPF